MKTKLSQKQIKEIAQRVCNLVVENVCDELNNIDTGDYGDMQEISVDVIKEIRAILYSQSN